MRTIPSESTVDVTPSSSDTTSRVSRSSPLRSLFILTASASAYLFVRKRSPTMETIILAYGYDMTSMSLS